MQSLNAVSTLNFLNASLIAPVFAPLAGSDSAARSLHSRTSRLREAGEVRERDGRMLLCRLS